MSRTTDGLIECFRKDEIEGLSMAQIIDFGFRGLKDESQVYLWFAILKDLYDHFKMTLGGHYAAADAIHDAVITGTLKTVVQSAAEGHTKDTWPRFFHEETPDILNRVHRETDLYRHIASEKLDPYS